MLPTSTAEQGLIVLRCAALGAVLAAFWDLLAAIRLEDGLRRQGTAVLDILFWLTALPCFLLFFLRHTDGRLRAYLPLGMLAGGWAWRHTLSPVLQKLLRLLLRGVRRCVRAGKRALIWVFSFPRGN